MRRRSHRSRLLMGVCFVMLIATRAHAATYYLSPAGRDAVSCAAAQSRATPKATFGSAWGCLRAGDTLIVGDGTYRSIAVPGGKSGTAAAPIVVRAPGVARVHAALILTGSSYLTFEGLTFVAPDVAIDVRSAGTGKPSHHVILQRVGFACTATGVNDNGCATLADGTHHVLMEDFWGWGGGRYTLMCYGGPGGNPLNTTCDNNTFRRGVLRMGPSGSSGGNPQAALALYYASNNLVENVIAIDGVASSNSSNAAFYITAHGPPPSVSGNRFLGVVALNNRGVGWYLDHDNGSIANNTILRDSVLWGATAQGAVAYGASNSQCNGTTIDHVTIGRSAGSAFENYCRGTVITASIFMSNAGDGLRNGSQGSLGTVASNAVSGTKRTGVSAGAGDIDRDPALKHILRVEPGTPCAGKCGATVVNRYQDGTLTTQALWPWPNEARIKTEMCATTPTRGFCAAPSLTAYIWGQLGNSRP